MLEYLGGSFDSWVISWFMLFGSFIYLSLFAIHHSSNLKKLQKHGKLITRKGTYSFVPHDIKERNK